MSVSYKPLVPRSLALVLSGGGARGAYEVGVLSYIYSEILRMRGGVAPKLDVICGTSVGAINACYLAAHAQDPASGMRRLVDLWTSLQVERVLKFDLGLVGRLPRVFRGGGEAAGIFDVTPMVDLITREVSWRMLARTLRRGHLRALCVSATEVSTGRTTLFVDTAPDVRLPTGLGSRVVVQRETVGPQHALASAAIPLVFPPVQIGAELYCDGGLRQNTPIAPAIRLGAERILVIGLSKENRAPAMRDAPPRPRDVAPGAMFLLGKVLNAFLLDHVQADVELLQRINQILDDGDAVAGPGFAERLSAHAISRGGEPYRKVETLVIRPSQDIGYLAAKHLSRGRVDASFVARRALALLDSGPGDESDLASYLLFDGAFARKLIELGRADAEAQRDRLKAFLEA